MLACGIVLIVLQPGIKPTYPASKCGVLTSELPGKYHKDIFKYLANINHLTSEQAAANSKSQADLPTNSKTYLG